MPQEGYSWGSDLQHKSSNTLSHSGHFCSSCSLPQHSIPAARHTPSLTGYKHQSGQTREQHDKEKYPFAAFTKRHFLPVFSISLVIYIQDYRNSQGHFSTFRFCTMFYSLNWMFSTTVLCFLMFCFRHFSLFMSMARQQDIPINAPAELSQLQEEPFFISIHIIFKEKHPFKMFNINLQSLMLEPTFLILFTQFNVQHQ